MELTRRVDSCIRNYVITGGLLLMLLPRVLAQQPFNPLSQWPDYFTVARRCYDSYLIFTDTLRIEFARHPDGWYVYEYQPFATTPQARYLYWDPQKKWQPLPYLALRPESPRPRNLPLSADTTAFSRIVWYGYPGWDRDVLNTFAAQADKQQPSAFPPVLLESLARAAYHRACNYIAAQTDFSLPDSLLFDKSILLTPAVRRDSFLHYARQSLAYWDKLWRHYPNYYTQNGNIRTERGHQYIAGWLIAGAFGADTAITRQLLPDTLYHEFPVSLAKNLLLTCAPQALLFVDNDIDFYPLLYVQAKLHIRPDVRVLHTDFLAAGWYLELLRKKNWLRAAPVVFEADSGWFEKSINTAQLFTPVVLHLPPADTTLRYKCFDRYQTGLSDTAIHWAIRPRNFELPFLFKSDRVLIRLINSIAAQGWGRPVYFAQSFDPDKLLGLQPFLQTEGAARRLIPGRPANYSYTTPPKTEFQLFLPRMTVNLLENYRYDGLAEPNIATDTIFRTIAMSYLTNYYYLAAALIAGKELPDYQIRKVLDIACLALPDKLLRWDAYVLLNLGRLYKQLDVTDRYQLFIQEAIRRLLPVIEPVDDLLPPQDLNRQTAEALYQEITQAQLFPEYQRQLRTILYRITRQPVYKE